MNPEPVQPGGFSRLDAQQHFTRELLPCLLYPILKRNRFDGTVAVVPAASVEETRWLLGLASEHAFIRGVVGWADLTDPAVGALLDEYQGHEKFLGVRWWFEGGLPAGLVEVERRGLTLDVAAGFSGEIPEAFPRLRVAADEWRSVPLACARHANLFVKISGLITPAPGRWKAAEFQAGVRATLAAFGAERVMFGSDWPSYLPEGTWKEALAAFTQGIGAQTMETRELLLGGTVRRFYGLA